MSLLTCFSDELTLARAFRPIEPSSIAKIVAESFVVQIRATLAAESFVDIISVGKLYYEVLNNHELRVGLQPDKTLNEHYVQKRLLLQSYLSEIFPNVAIKGPWVFDEASEYPYSGLRLLQTVGAFFLRQQWEQDRKLQNLSLEKLETALCLSIHDSVCSGSGIELETIGLFKACSFTASDILLATIKASLMPRRRRIAR